MKKRNLFNTLLALLAMFALTVTLSGCDHMKEASFHAQLEKSVRDMNKSCPMMIDKETRLENAAVVGRKTIEYNFKLINYSKKDLNLDTLQQKMRPIVTNTIRTNPTVKIFRDHNASFMYNYKDKDGVLLFTMSISPKDYKGSDSSN